MIQFRTRWRPVLGILAALLLGACVAGREDTFERGARDAISVTGPILDTRTGERIDPEAAIRHAVASRYVILGEIHDNAVHHQLQAVILRAMVGAGRLPGVAMEQFDQENQSSLDAARGRGERDAERLADAGRFDRKGWRWPDYKPLVEIAAARGLALIAANLSREDARAVIKSGLPAKGLAPVTPAQRAALEQDIVEGHCGIRPPAPLLAGMIEAQRARDARMAESLGHAGESGAVLIAGAGHARRDRGAPSYLAPAQQTALLSLAFVEVAPDGTPPRTDYAGIYDLVWFTPRAKREDPCRNFRLQ